MLALHFADEETKAQGGYVTGPRLQSESQRQGLNRDQFDSSILLGGDEVFGHK